MVNPTTESQSNSNHPHGPNQPNHPNQSTAYPSWVDSPLFQQALAQLRTDNDRQCIKKFITDAGQLGKEHLAAIDAAEDRFHEFYIDAMMKNDNHHVVPMIGEAINSLLRDITKLTFELHQKLRGETTRQGSKLCQAEFDARKEELSRRMYQRQREIIHTHARLSQEDLQRYDRAMDDREHTLRALGADYRARIDQLADDAFQGSDIVFLGHSKFESLFYVNSIYGWSWLVLNHST